MKKLSCKDLGSGMCNFTATGQTSEEVIKKMFDHAAKDHADMLAKMSDAKKQQMTNKMNELLSKQP